MEENTILEATTEEALPKAKKKLSLTTILILAAVALLVIVAAVIFLVHNSPTSVAKRYVKGFYTNEQAFVSSLAFDYKAYLLYDYDGSEDEFFEAMSDLYEVDISSWRDYYKAVDEDSREGLEDSFGKYKVTAEATRTKEKSVDWLRLKTHGWLGTLEEEAGFDHDSIKAVRLVTVKLKIAGDKIKRETCDVIVVRTGLFWGVLDEYDEDEYEWLLGEGSSKIMKNRERA